MILSRFCYYLPICLVFYSGHIVPRVPTTLLHVQLACILIFRGPPYASYVRLTLLLHRVVLRHVDHVLFQHARLVLELLFASHAHGAQIAQLALMLLPLVVCHARRDHIQQITM